MPSARPPRPVGVPRNFRVDRKVPLGRHPLLAVFPHLDALSTAEHLEPDATKRAKLFDETCVQIVDEDLWMYVAPFDVPPRFRRRAWRPIVSPGSDCIVVGEKHLRESELLILFLDIFHELCHVQQRQAGAELFGGAPSYVDRPTEVDAYRFVVNEAKELGVGDEVLREYLRVEWINDEEHLRLLKATGVSASPAPSSPS
jgi:hypothetical protein